MPSIVMTPPDIARLALDVFAGFLLSQIDGRTTLQEIAFAHGMAPDVTLRLLSELYLRGVIALEP